MLPVCIACNNLSTLYTFNAYRIFTPLFIVSLAFIYQRNLRKHLEAAFASTVLAILLLLPREVPALPTKEVAEFPPRH